MGLQIGGVEFSNIFEPNYNSDSPSYQEVLQENGVNIRFVYFSRTASNSIDKVNGISPYAIASTPDFLYPQYYAGRTNVGQYYLKKYHVYYGNTTVYGQISGTPNVIKTATDAAYNIGNHAYIGIMVVAGGNNGSAGGANSAQGTGYQSSGGGGKGGDSGEVLFQIISIVPNSTMNITIGGAGQNTTVVYSHPVNGATTITARYNAGNQAGGAATLGGVANDTASTLTRNPVNGNPGATRAALSTIAHTTTVALSSATATGYGVAGATNDADATTYYRLYAGGSGGSTGGPGIISNSSGGGGNGGRGYNGSLPGLQGSAGGNASNYGGGGGGGGGSGGHTASIAGVAGGSGYQGVVYIFY